MEADPHRKIIDTYQRRPRFSDLPLVVAMAETWYCLNTGDRHEGGATH
ncbi:MAG: hypothetical protein ACJA1J_003523 [Sulfitobacter pontiacus]|jgi:hypothetical protein